MHHISSKRKLNFFLRKKIQKQNLSIKFYKLIGGGGVVSKEDVDFKITVSHDYASSAGSAKHKSEK